MHDKTRRQHLMNSPRDNAACYIQPMIILASKSKIRQQLLRQAGVVFTTVDVPYDETKEKLRHSHLPARQLAQVLAIGKAKFTSILYPEAFVIGADQTLEFEGKVFHQPAGLKQAEQHLKTLCNQTHQLHSAVAVTRGQEIVFETCAKATLKMRQFSDAFLEGYLAREGHKILGSVGCYHIETEGLQLFETIEGDYFTILGLPLLSLLSCLRNIGQMPQ